MNDAASQREIAMFGAGCFWGVEETFRSTDGVLDTAVGYAGGTTEQPDYKLVCGGSTGHAEVVRVEFDPAVTSFEALLEVFWANHNPTTPNRQGPDIGTQYRSVIFAMGPGQREAAERSKSEHDASGRFNAPIVTEIVDEAPFWAAEDYHQQYLAKRGMSNCHI